MPVNGGATRIGLSETPWMCWSAGSAGKPAKSMNVGKRSTYSIAQSQRCDMQKGRRNLNANSVRCVMGSAFVLWVQHFLTGVHTAYDISYKENKWYIYRMPVGLSVWYGVVPVAH